MSFSWCFATCFPLIWCVVMVRVLFVTLVLYKVQGLRVLGRLGSGFGLGLGIGLGRDMAYRICILWSRSRP